ncbi:hypothetical protein CPB85DRAFT_313203 [Mucidula mucida]|nr:hypothetical protein CPB85DRAFT_313203 [Mucidula mucida]
MIVCIFDGIPAFVQNDSVDLEQYSFESSFLYYHCKKFNTRWHSDSGVHKREGEAAEDSSQSVIVLLPRKYNQNFPRCSPRDWWTPRSSVARHYLPVPQRRGHKDYNARMSFIMRHIAAMSIPKAGVPSLFQNTGRLPREQGLRPGPLALQADVLQEDGISPASDIATAVTHVSISPSDSECIWEQSHLAMDSILDAIFTTLPNFPHLTTLVCSHIRITTQRMIGLRVLRLRSISLDSCSFDEGSSRMPGMDVMPLDTVRLTGAAAPDAAFLSLFLNPPHLHRLYATPCDTILAALLRKEQPFSHLTDLDISLACIPSQDFIPVLSKCPHLKRLCIHQPQPTRERIRKHKLESLPNTVIPELNFFRGPHAYLSRILDSRKVKTVDVSFSCSPESIIKVAEKCLGRF